jgi:quinol monooxygenase YgiN
MMIRVVAVITAKPGHLGELLAAFRANAPTVLKEEGCHEYAAFTDAEGAGPIQAPFGPDTFVVLETWDSMAALGAHAAAPHMRDYAKATKDLTAGRAIHVLTAA